MKHEIYKANSIISNTNVELSSKITLQDERYINICLKIYLVLSIYLLISCATIEQQAIVTTIPVITIINIRF